MKEIFIKNYECDFCKKIFDNHEKTEHKCPNCEHSYYVYGCELNCDLENQNKKCKFEEKIND